MKFTGKDLGKIFIQSLPVLLLLLFTWFRASAMLARVTDPDPGLFETFAYHMQQGKALYSDIWDHKPPLVFYLNLIFLQIFGPTENAISYGSLIFALGQTLVFYFLLLRFTKNTLSAFAGTLLFISTYFSVFVFGSGNYTEQYAVLCTSAALLLFLNYVEKRNHNHLWFAGMLFGTAVWFKEPFVFSAVPYFIYLLVRSVKRKDEWRYLLHFTLACMVPALLTANLIVMTGGKEGYLEHLTHSRLYALSSNTSPLLTKLLDNHDGFFSAIPISDYLLIPAYLLCLAFLIYRKTTRIIFILIGGQQLLDYLGTGMSGNRFFHYYMQTVPLTLIVITTALAHLGEIPGILRRWKLTFIPVAILSLSLIVMQTPWRAMAASPVKTFRDPIVEYMDRHEYYKPRSVAMAGKDIGFYLLRVQAVSEVRYVVPYPYHWINMPGQPVHHQMSEDSARFIDWQPDYVIYSGTFTEMYQDCGLDSYILENYQEVAHTDLMPGKTAYLLKRRNFDE